MRQPSLVELAVIRRTDEQLSAPFDELADGASRFTKTGVRIRVASPRRPYRKHGSGHQCLKCPNPSAEGISYCADCATDITPRYVREGSRLQRWLKERGLA